jgi:hypothetical protein
VYNQWASGRVHRWEWKLSGENTGVYDAPASTLDKWAVLIGEYDGVNSNLDVWYDLDVSDGISLTAGQDTSAPPSIVVHTGQWQLSGLDGQKCVADTSFWPVLLNASERAELYSGSVPADLRNHSRYADLLRWWRYGNGGPCGADGTSGVINQNQACTSAILEAVNFESGDFTTSEGYPGS